MSQRCLASVQYLQYKRIYYYREVSLQIFVNSVKFQSYLSRISIIMLSSSLQSSFIASEHEVASHKVNVRVSKSSTYRPHLFFGETSLKSRSKRCNAAAAKRRTMATMFSKAEHRRPKREAGNLLKMLLLPHSPCSEETMTLTMTIRPTIERTFRL
jgi:hypothetical protein